MVGRSWRKSVHSSDRQERDLFYTSIEEPYDAEEEARMVKAEARAQARARAEAEAEARRPIIGDRFFRLPGELRAHVYRLLLTQPCKWNMVHDRDCKPLDYPPPVRKSVPRVLCQFLCETCCLGQQTKPEYDVDQWNIFNYRNIPRTKRLRVSLEFSQWYNPQSEQYMCLFCHANNKQLPDASMRGEPRRWPKVKMCLCTRRRNLSLLLANKQVNEEAGHVFWSENCFAFENQFVLAGFLWHIRPEIRSILTQISVLETNYFTPQTDFFRQPDLPPGDPSDWPHYAYSWRLLRECRGLVSLELDCSFLEQRPLVRALRGMTVSKKVSFVSVPRADQVRKFNPWTVKRYGKLVWPHLERRQLESATTSSGSFALQTSWIVVKGNPEDKKRLTLLFQNLHGLKENDVDGLESSDEEENEDVPHGNESEEFLLDIGNWLCDLRLNA